MRLGPGTAAVTPSPSQDRARAAPARKLAKSPSTNVNSADRSSGCPKRSGGSGNTADLPATEHRAARPPRAAGPSGFKGETFHLGPFRISLAKSPSKNADRSSADLPCDGTATGASREARGRPSRGRAASPCLRALPAVLRALMAHRPSCSERRAGTACPRQAARPDADAASLQAPSRSGLWRSPGGSGPRCAKCRR